MQRSSCCSRSAITPIAATTLYTCSAGGSTAPERGYIALKVSATSMVPPPSNTGRPVFLVWVYENHVVAQSVVATRAPGRPATPKTLPTPMFDLDTGRGLPITLEADGLTSKAQLTDDEPARFDAARHDPRRDEPCSDDAGRHQANS